MGRVVAWPGSPTHHAQQLEEIERLQAVEREAVALLAKVAEYQLRGYKHIRLGAHDKLRAAVEGP